MPPAATPYRYTAIVRSCQLGMFVQAMVINLTPLLFIPLREEFGLTFEQIGRLVLINFITQMLVDLACAAAPRLPVKPLVVGANVAAVLGLLLFAWAPFHLAAPYPGLVFGTVLFSIGCGLLEVLLSPLINAVPSARKSADMALLHAFYPVGKVVVIVVTGLLLGLGHIAWWPWIVAAWALVPLANTLAFATLRLPALDALDAYHTLGALGRGRLFYLLLAAMVLAGATEVTLAQWTSAYVQTALGFPKIVADLVGFGLFGLGMIGGRLWFGLREGSNRLAAGAALERVGQHRRVSGACAKPVARRGARRLWRGGRGRKHALAGDPLALRAAFPARRRRALRRPRGRGRRRRGPLAVGRRHRGRCRRRRPTPRVPRARALPGGATRRAALRGTHARPNRAHASPPQLVSRELPACLEVEEAFARLIHHVVRSLVVEQEPLRVLGRFEADAHQADALLPSFLDPRKHKRVVAARLGRRAPLARAGVIAVERAVEVAHPRAVLNG